MGLFNAIRRLLGGRPRPCWERVESLLGPWRPYEGSATLPRSRLPWELVLPEGVSRLGDSPGCHRFGRILWRYWLRLDRGMVGLLLSELKKGNLYRAHTREREGREPRILHEPHPVLKFVQRRILERVLEQMDVHEAAHGFRKGRSIFTNAAAHTGQAVVVNLDLRDFFPSITFPRVAGLFVSSGFSRNVACRLAGLCCYRGVLPQGAPTSPAISNLICRRLDARLTGLMRRCGGTYTRYADDLTFSGPVAILSALPMVRRIVAAEGFAVAPEKTRIARSGARQMVTGLVVNDRVSVPRRVRRLLRAMVHRAASEPIADPALIRCLRGYLSFLKPAHPDDVERLRQQLDGP